MKKVVSTILCIAFSLGMMAGCSHDIEEEVEKDVTYPAYSQVWRVTETDVEHAIGDLSIDDGWGAIPFVDKVGALCTVETETLRKTAYTAAARILVNDVNSASKDVACVLRVLDKNGVELGRRNVRIAEFDAKLTYQDFEFTFPVEADTEATFEIYWPGTNYVRVSEFGIMSQTMSDLKADNTGATLLGADIEEEGAIEYSESALYYFDLYDYMQTVALDSEQQYDIANLVCTLQGLVNRDGQRLYVRFVQPNDYSQDTDGYWLQELTQEGAWLADKDVVTVKSPTTLLNLFGDYYEGFAAWDSNVPATVNAVATACGVDGLLPVRYSTVRNSLYYYITTDDSFAQKPVKVNLGGVFEGGGTIYGTNTPSTGSRKNDVYIWAKENYLDTHKVNSHMMAYHVDAYGSNTVFAAYGDLQNMYLSNRDYYIANKTFFFDLSVEEFFIPDDDPDQAGRDGNAEGSIDYVTLEQIMKAQAKYAEEVDASKPIDIGGFTPWHMKYTKYTDPLAPGEVDVEWDTVYIFSMFNAYINADAPHYTAMANASVFANYPAKEQYTQKGNKTVTEHLPTASERGANYIMFYMGDFDASSWLNTAMIKLWNDENRGKIPLNWTFSLDTAKRAGHVIDMMYETATENDYFVAGDNGVGYFQPNAFDDSRHDGIYGDLDSWAAYNKIAYDKYDIDFTGILITKAPKTGSAQAIMECYAKFCSGIAVNQPAYITDAKAEGLSVTQSVDYIGRTPDQLIAAAGFQPKSVGDQSTFRSIRFVLRSPTDAIALYDTLTSDAYASYNFKLVDPYTFYALLAEQGTQG